MLCCSGALSPHLWQISKSSCHSERICQGLRCCNVQYKTTFMNACSTSHKTTCNHARCLLPFTVIFLTAVTFIPLCCKKLLARLLATQVVLAEKKFIYLICSELRPFLRAGCTTKPLQQCTQRASC